MNIIASIFRGQCRNLAMAVQKQPRNFCFKGMSTESSNQPEMKRNVSCDQGSRMDQRIKYLEQMNYRLTMNETKTEAILNLPGMSYASYDQDGNVSILSLIWLLGSGESFAYYKPLDDSQSTFLDYSRMMVGRLTFAASVVIDIDKTMYDRTVPKSPLDMRLQIRYIGNSSWNSVGTLLVASTGQELARYMKQNVTGDKMTRRSKPLPGWWKEKFAQFTQGNKPLIFNKMSKPNETFMYDMRVFWIDTYENMYTHWSSYVLFCINGLRQGIKENFFKNITNEVVRNGIKKITMNYIGKSSEGDRLSVHAWESPDDPFTVCFDIHKKGKTVYQSSISYYSEGSEA